jgi:phospholipid-binding lipoprotein MlaA
MRRNALVALVGAVVVCGASVADAQSAPPPPAPVASANHTPGDPWEHLNRINYAIEGGLDKHVIGPIARLYAAITPGPIGRGIHNVLVNLSEPTVFFNDVLQLRFKRAGVTAGRFVTNTTIGVLGLVDVANKLGLPHHDNEFGVTLGHYGFYAGPYMFLPLGGPTTVRDLVGAGVDLLMDPFHWLRFASQTEINGTRLVTGGLDTRNATEGELNSLLADATDPYATLRSVYLQNKQSEIDGEGAPLALPSIDDTPAVTSAPPGPTAANMFPDASSELQPDAAQKAADDAAALKLIVQPEGLASADMDRAAELGRTLGGVRGVEKSLAVQIKPQTDPSQGADAPAADRLDQTLASAN